jgi:hypothetical protein
MLDIAFWYVPVHRPLFVTARERAFPALGKN